MSGKYGGPAPPTNLSTRRLGRSSKNARRTHASLGGGGGGTGGGLVGLGGAGSILTDLEPTNPT
jgi:hypothetical protein